MAFLAFVIRVKDEAAAIDRLQKNHADIGKAFLIDRCQAHGIGVIGFRLSGIGQPFLEQRNRFAALGEALGRHQSGEIAQ